MGPYRSALFSVSWWILIAVSLLSSSCRGVLSVGGAYKLREAEEYLRQERYDDAISAYQAHMEERLKLRNRPDWENPYFYYLLIGDIELGRDRVDDALHAYQLAEQHHIHRSLISDRYRYVANWYEKHGEYEKALELLTQHRELDPLLFDATLDRIAKALIRSAEPVPTIQGSAQ